MFSFSFTKEEIHQMFLNFYHDMDKNESLVLELNEIITIIDLFVDKIGKNTMQ